IGSIPTSRMSLTVLDPAPIEDFTFTKDQWQPRYRQRILKGNTSLDRNIEEDGQSSEEAKATASDDKEPSPVVPCKRQKSDDQVVASRVKDLAHQSNIMY
ncbi:unnamed protein product, partial [Candidula unifasciata]